MKIAILSFYSGHNYRGVERWVRELATRLSKKHEVYVYQNWSARRTTSYKVFSTKIFFDFSKKKDDLNFTGRAFLDYKGREKACFVLKLLPRLWREKFDIIIPTDGGWEPAFIRILCWLQRSKMVIVGHAGIGWDDRNNLWSFPNVFVALSKMAKKWAKRVNPFVRIEHISDGVNTSKFKPLGKKKSFNLKRPIIFCAGALIPSKRIDLTIKAISKLKDASLLVAGGGVEEKRLKKLGKKLLGNRFYLKEFKFSQMPEIYRSADVFTIASRRFYSFEMVLVEAMAVNLPVVVNNDPIRKEIVGDVGILVDPKNTDAYAKALKKALKTDWGNRPRKQAEKFSWNKVVRQYEELFENLVK